MRLKLVVVTILALGLSSAHCAGYWDRKIPTPKGASKIETEKNEAFSTVILEYNLVVRDPITIKRFYGDFFDSIGWVNPFDSPRIRRLAEEKGNPETWSVHGSLNEEGEPFLAYGTFWNSDHPPAIARLSVVLERVTEEGFLAKVIVLIGPDLVSENDVKISQLIISDPGVFFKIVDFAGPYFAQRDFRPFSQELIENILKKDTDDPILIEFQENLRATLDDYREYHEKYNQ